MAFDLSEVLKDVSVPDTGREQIEYLPYATLLPDPNNGFSMDGIEELARGIELVGLQQPLRVREIPGAYAILSGHRRYAAIGLIRRQNPGAFADGVPCIVDRADGSSAWRELQLLLGNADNRKNTPSDELRLINGVSDCIRKLEAEGYEFPGRHREWISRMVGMSNTRIGRLQAIEKHLAASLLDHFNAGDLSVTAAYRLSQEPEQIQHDVYRTLGRGINDLTEAQLEERIARAKAPRQAPAPAPVTRSSFDAEAYLRQRQDEDDTFFEMLTRRAREFLRELNAPAPVNTRSEGIECLKQRFRHRGAWGGDLPSYQGSAKGLEMEDLTIDSPIFRTWTEVYDMLCNIALCRAALGAGWNEDQDDEDEEPEEEPLPVVRWEGRSVTPPTRELLLLYQLTNAGPQLTPAVYEGGAVFKKPGPGGKVLDGIQHNFTRWLKLPDPREYDAAYQVAPPVSAADTTPTWQTGDPPTPGWYICWAVYMTWDPDYEPRYWNGEFWGETDLSTTPPDDEQILAWAPIPQPEKPEPKEGEA